MSTTAPDQDPLLELPVEARRLLAARAMRDQADKWVTRLSDDPASAAALGREAEHWRDQVAQMERRAWPHRHLHALPSD